MCCRDLVVGYYYEAGTLLFMLACLKQTFTKQAWEMIPPPLAPPPLSHAISLLWRRQAACTEKSEILKIGQLKHTVLIQNESLSTTIHILLAPRCESSSFFLTRIPSFRKQNYWLEFTKQESLTKDFNHMRLGNFRTIQLTESALISTSERRFDILITTNRHTGWIHLQCKMLYNHSHGIYCHALIKSFNSLLELRR